MSIKVRVSSDFHTLSVSAICSICLFSSAAAATNPLKSYNVDPTQISVSGISAGGYMAQQFHVAFSSTIMGAGIIAGGPYYCAENTVNRAMTVCSAYGEKYFGQQYVGPPSSADVDKLVTYTRNQSGKTIDPIASLQAGRVFMFSGSNDRTVPTDIMDALKDYYDKIGVTNVHYVKGLPAGHAQIIREDYPTFDANDCGTSDPPYINECETAFPPAQKGDADLAGSILKFIYGSLDSPQKSTHEAIEFDQAEFAGGAPNNIGLDEKGYLYVPNACADDGVSCKLHVAFHGCHQGKNQAPEGNSSKYVKYAGYNEWAEQNNIIVLYPQVFPSPNPNGCWDWWGQAYTDASYANKSGKQMAAVKAMINRVAKIGEVEQCFTTDNPTHVANSRAYACGLFGLWACAQGSDDDLDLNFFFITTSLKQTGPGSWTKVANCPQ